MFRAARGESKPRTPARAVPPVRVRERADCARIRRAWADAAGGAARAGTTAPPMSFFAGMSACRDSPCTAGEPGAQGTCRVGPRTRGRSGLSRALPCGLILLVLALGALGGLAPGRRARAGPRQESSPVTVPVKSEMPPLSARKKYHDQQDEC